MTRMKLIMKNRSQTSASFRMADLGRELMREERREANTKKPVMAPMNLQREKSVLCREWDRAETLLDLLLKSFTSMKRVK